MAYKFSVVLIAKNEEHNIGKCLKALQGLTDDVVVVENGSTDNTIKVAQQHGARVIESDWLGYGDTKNLGHSVAKYDWILSLDADEIVDESLFLHLSNWEPSNGNAVYTVARHQVWSGVVLSHGGAKEYKVRLFNRHFARWNDSLVHEQLIYTGTCEQRNIAGKLLHYSYSNEQDAYAKNEKYARSYAIQKARRGAKTGILPPWLYGAASFFYAYILQLGFIEGSAGLAYCKLKQWYKTKKYAFVKEEVGVK